MNKFTERLEVPKSDNKFYNSKINPFVNAGYGMFQKGGNCTCYAYGRAYELLNKDPKLPTSNAENWYKDSKYNKSKTPSLGDIIVFRCGKIHYAKDGAGHVGVVEKIYNNGDILVSESGYKSFLFRTVIYTKKSGYTNILGSKYTLEGFVHILNNEVKEEIKKKENKKDDKKEVVKYIVKKGDTLSSIAKKYNTTWQKIYDDNKELIDKTAKKHKVKENFYNYIYPKMELIIK